VCSHVTPSGYYLGLASSGATPEMKTYTLKIFNSQSKLSFPILKHSDQDELLLCLTELEKYEPCMSMG